MSTKPQIELFLENESGTQQVAYPFVESDHVSLSNGMDIDTMIRQDVSMPTVTHEDLSFKVGVGDQDVSSAIVDSSVAEMTIKGKTYQNILPEPSTHVLTNNKEMFKVNEGLDPNVEIVDGVSKSAILSGNTLVNISRFTKMSVNSSSVSVDDDGWVTISNPTGNYNNAFYGVTGLEKPNTQYTLILEIKENTRTGVFSFIQTNDYYPSVFNLVQNISIEGGFVGTKKFLLTTKEDLSDCLVTSRTFVDSSGGTLIFRQVLIEGDYTDVDIPYFEGMTSCKVPVLQTVGKNLFDGKLEKGFINGSGGYGTSTTAVRSTNYIRVTPNTKYIINSNDYTGSVYVHEYDADHNHTNQIAVKSFTTSSNTHYVKFNTHTNTDLDVTTNFQFEEGSTVTSYEPYKTNILHTPEEVVLRSLPNGVKDTLNLNTGEYVQRIGEIILDGSEPWNKDTTTGGTKDNTSIFHTEANFNGFKPSPNVEYRDTMMLCDKIPVKGRVYNLDEEGLMINGDGRIYIRINLSRLETNNAGGFKSFLAKENIKIQCELATPVVKTVDLSSSGNWEKVVLDGKSSENWQQNSHSGNFVQFEGYSNFCLYSTGLPLANRGLLCDSLDYYNYDSGFRHKEVEGISDGGGYRLIFVRVKTEKLPTNNVAGFKQWLSQNPIEVSYMLSSNKDSTQVKQPIFFKNGHVIQSSGADNSLIPTLDYQAKTSNSYVMDLMKTNTKYTMKAKSASGTFTIDGTSYGAGTNGTFTTPTSMTNKLLVMSNKTNTEVMILEGDVTDKTIPYFKGIKSAFEDEGKIEVLSTGKNLFTLSKLTQFNSYGMKATVDGETLLLSGTPTSTWAVFITKNVLEVGKTYTVSYYENGIFSNNYKLWGRDKDGNLPINHRSGQTFTFSSEIVRLEMVVEGLVVGELTNKRITIQIEESPTRTAYDSYKSNVSKIPLLSSLRSLPTGVCDEVIINRETKKATLIQRVGYVMLNGSEEWNLYPSMEQDKTLLFQTKKPTVDGKNAYCVSDKYFHSPSLWSSYYNEGIQLGGGSQISRVDLRVYKGKVSSNNATILREYLSKDPIVVLYELATPIITEVDLEGFPYIYKDGHIFLNGDITPVTEIKYSINQQHQIEASNQDIIRHQKEIDYLYKLIGEYVRVDYKNTLLSLNLELK